MKTSKDPRHQARRFALGVVYSVESKTDVKYSHVGGDLIGVVKSTLEVANYDKFLFKTIIETIPKNIKEFKDVIAKSSIDWEIPKLYKIDLSILLIAVCEMYKKTAPVKVIIDEAIELAKEFGEADSPKFVNGILAGVVQNYEKI